MPRGVVGGSDSRREKFDQLVEHHAAFERDVFFIGACPLQVNRQAVSTLALAAPKRQHVRSGPPGTRAKLSF